MKKRFITVMLALTCFNAYSQLDSIVITYDYVNYCEYKRWKDQDTCNYWYEEKHVMIMEVNEYGEPTKITLSSDSGKSVFQRRGSVYEYSKDGIDYRVWDAIDDKGNKLAIYLEDCFYLELRYKRLTISLANDYIFEIME